MILDSWLELRSPWVAFCKFKFHIILARAERVWIKVFSGIAWDSWLSFDSVYADAIKFSNSWAFDNGFIFLYKHRVLILPGLSDLKIFSACLFSQRLIPLLLQFFLPGRTRPFIIDVIVAGARVLS